MFTKPCEPSSLVSCTCRKLSTLPSSSYDVPIMWAYFSSCSSNWCYTRPHGVCFHFHQIMIQSKSHTTQGLTKVTSIKLFLTPSLKVDFSLAKPCEPKWLWPLAPKKAVSALCSR